MSLEKTNNKLVHSLIEGESSIMNKKITNPDTGRKVKVSSALGYEDDSVVKQKAQALLSKTGESQETESPEKRVPEKDRKKVVAILDKLKSMSDEASAKGEKAPDYDLCKVSVPGTNLFCQVSLDIPRQEMPQLKGQALPDSPADKLPKDNKGEVDTEALFKEALKQSGAKMSRKKVDASTLKATQSELVGAKVAGMTAALKKDPKNPGITAPIFVSKDGYILDGHHRWAAQVGLSLNKDKPVMMDVVEVDMDAKQLVDFTNKFCNDIGIKQKAGKVKESYNMDKMKKKIKLSEAISKIETVTGKKVLLSETKKQRKTLTESLGTNTAKFIKDCLSGEQKVNKAQLLIVVNEFFEYFEVPQFTSFYNKIQKGNKTVLTSLAKVISKETKISLDKVNKILDLIMDNIEDVQEFKKIYIEVEKGLLGDYIEEKIPASQLKSNNKAQKDDIPKEEQKDKPKKYYLDKKDTIKIKGITLYRIISMKGSKGGYIESESNLSQNGGAWVYDNALVFNNARVSGNAQVSGNAKVFGDAKVSGEVWVYDNAQVSGNAEVSENAIVSGEALVSGNAKVSGRANVYGKAQVLGNTQVLGNKTVKESTTADIAVPEIPADIKKMKPNTKINTDADYLVEDIPSTKGDVVTEGFQKVKSLCSQFKLHIEKSSVETTQGTKESFAITFPKKVAFQFIFMYKLNKLGYMLVVDSLAKYKMHIIEKPKQK